jgi:hypothetical protein
MPTEALALNLTASGISHSIALWLKSIAGEVTFTT